MADVGGTMSDVSAPVRRVLLISAGASHSVALLLGNVVCSWGRGEDGQLGHGDAEDRLSPTYLSALDGHEVVSVTCGADHTTAYSESFTQVYSWGWVYWGLTMGLVQAYVEASEIFFFPDESSGMADSNGDFRGHCISISNLHMGDFGRLGHGNSSDLFTPQPIKALHGLRIKQIACGDSHCLAVTMDGEVQSWGRNQNGQLGLGTTEDSLVPQKIQAFQSISYYLYSHGDKLLHDFLMLAQAAQLRLVPQGVSVKMVAAGAEHTAAVTEDGELYGWGWGRYGNLGLGDRNDRLVPEKVSTVEGVKMVKVACGWRHTISVSSSGGLYTYGWSKYGQLGHGDFEDHLTPHKLEALQENLISEISGGWRHTMALTSDGKLYGWGWNKFGQVGVGDNVDHCSPVQVKFPHEQKVVHISCGWRHTLAVTERQNVFSWGRGTNGQLGHGESIDR
ncbi:Ultraviolet-B receptor UVR8 [Vitis vinifera]|uniref:Ultraviolet-B receptor UVR8 n=1 Tax=Vitis vinifera TaxID=29760 RepID=A0A438KJP4_VITVI|nr:Ultraviolet-B receptor UVR8 [Vitis vinifera]